MAGIFFLLIVPMTNGVYEVQHIMPITHASTKYNIQRYYFNRFPVLYDEEYHTDGLW